MIWASCPGTPSYYFRRLPANLFKDPAFSIGMIGCCSWGTMNLTWAVKYAVQAGGARIKMLMSLLPLHGLRTTGSCVDRRFLGAFFDLERLYLLHHGLRTLLLSADASGVLAMLLFGM